MPFLIGTRTVFVPGAYAITNIINEGGSVIPVFNVGVIVAEAAEGLPYTVGTGGTPAMTADEFIKPYADVASMKRDKGSEGNSPMVRAMRYAKAGGAGTVFALNVRPLTPVTLGEIQNVTPVKALTISTTGKKYGAAANHISITIAAYVHTIIGPKNITHLTVEGATGQPTVTVADVRDYKAGDSVYIAANDTAPVAHEIETVNATAKTITFTANLAATLALAQYPVIYQEDTENQEVSSEALDTVDKVTAFYGNSAYCNAAIASGITIMPITLTKTYLNALTNAVDATSPAATGTDWQNVADDFARWNEEFAIVNKVYMRILNLVTGDDANHASFVALATTMRTNNKPIALVSGCVLGDYTLSNGDEPPARALALNSDEIQLAGFGADGYDPYLSYGPYIFGIRVGSAVNHNQTADLLGNGVFLTVEKAFYRDDPALEVYVKAGVMAIIMDKFGYKIVQGVTTYQDQTTTFNTNSRKTYLVALRDLADFDLRVMMELLDQYAGADNVTKESVANAVMGSSEILKNDLLYISGYAIQSITKKPSGWEVKRKIGLDSPTDFIGLINNIVID